jgi:enoyl-CoA hydratase/carnithine racemase
VNQIVERDELDDAAVALAAEIAGNAPVSLKGNKQIIGKLLAFGRLSEAEQKEVIDLRLSSFRTHDFREGVRAFSEKRKPDWEGR